MIGAVMAVRARVPVPDLGPRPGTFEPGVVEQVLLVLAMLGVVFFVAVVMTTRQRVERGGSLWGLPILGILAMGLPLIPVAVLEYTGRAEAREAIRAYQTEENAVQDATKVDMEEAFGIVYEDEHPFIPVQRGEYSRESMTLPDGTVQECFTVAGDDGYYAIRCGGERPDEGVELEPAMS